MEQDNIQSTGQKFGKYEIVEELGRGAMGVVYKARDPLIGRLVALKTVMPGLLSDSDLLKRFYREAQSAGRLQHPNIVIIHDLGEADGLPYIAMELVEGESLQKIIARQAPLPLATKLRILIQICNGLGYAHQHGVVHRDVKPANILVAPNGSVKVVDFGIVHLADTGMTQSGMILGTVSYMSPEQLRGEQVDRRSDIFSVGIVMYELLAYRKTFDGPNVTAIMLKIASEEPPSLAEAVPGLPSALDEIVRKCLRKDREERFQTLEDLALEIEPYARRLQREVVEAMVEESRDLLARREFARAEEVLRSALALDSSHDAAKGLMSQAQTELRRLRASAKVQQSLDEGQRLFDQKKFAEAAKAFEEVLRVDSQHGQARDLLQRAGEAAAKATEVRKRLVAAKRALSEGDLTLAESELRKALEADAEQAEAAGLLERIRQERAAQERRFRLREGMASARDLMTMERYDEAQAQLQALQIDFPGEAEVGQLLTAVEQKIAERRQVQEAFNEVKALLEQQKFQEAMDRAETVRFQFPKDAESTRLYNFARAESELAERRQRLELEVTELQEQVKNQRYADALAHGERLQREFPASVEVARLLMLARSEKQAADRLEQVEDARKSIQTLWDGGQRVEAAREAEAALEMFPSDPSLTRTLSALRDEIARQATSARSDAAVGSASATLLFPAATPGLGAPGSVGQEASDSGAIAGLSQPFSGIGEAPAGSITVPAVVKSTAAPPSRTRSLLIPTAAAILILGLVALGYVILHARSTEHPPAAAAAPAANPESESSGSTAVPGSGRAPSAAIPAQSSTNVAPGNEAGSQGVTPLSSAPKPGAASLAIERRGARASETKPAAPEAVATRSSGATAGRNAATGELVVTANVDGAKILIDGNDSGELTPHTFSNVPAGTRSVSVMKDGYPTASKRFDVPAGGTVTASIQLVQPTGLLEFITNPPGAAVSIDGTSYGNTPIKITITAGQHKFSVTLGTQTKEGTLVVAADGYAQKEVDFAQ